MSQPEKIFNEMFSFLYLVHVCVECVWVEGVCLNEAGEKMLDEITPSFQHHEPPQSPLGTWAVISETWLSFFFGMLFEQFFVRNLKSRGLLLPLFPWGQGRGRKKRACGGEAVEGGGVEREKRRDWVEELGGEEGREAAGRISEQSPKPP